MFRGSDLIQHRNLSMNLNEIWWCLLLTLHFYVKTILNTALYLSLSLYIHLNPHSIIYLLYVPSNWNGKYLNFFCLYIPQKTGVSTKNVLRMFKAHFLKKYKNVEPRWKNSPFLQKKACNRASRMYRAIKWKLLNQNGKRCICFRMKVPLWFSMACTMILK